MTALSRILMFLLVAMQNLYLGYVALLIFTIQRSFTFAVFFSYIPATFGSANYGRLIGFATLVSGAFGFVNGSISSMSGLRPSALAVCNQGLACENRRDCALPNLAIAASMFPLILYSVWLSGRLARLNASNDPTS